MQVGTCLAIAIIALGCSSDTLAPRQTSDAPGQPRGTGTAGASSTASPGSGDFSPPAEYPPGPYGQSDGAVIYNLDFLGWMHPAEAQYDPAALEVLSLADFFDPTAQHTRLLVLNASAVWCAVCQAEMAQIKREGLYARYRQRGVEFLGTLFEDQNGNPATPSDLVLWGSAPARAIEFPLVLDPGLTMGIYFAADATPLNLIIDTQTMRIVHVSMGYDGSETGLWSVVDAELASRGISPP